MKNIIKFSILIMAIVPLFYSCNFLDVDDYFNETLKMDSVFANKRNFEKYLWGTAYMFSDEGRIWGQTSVPGVSASDEGFSLGSGYNGLNLVRGLVTPTNLQGMNIWDNHYKIIRKANTMLANVNKPYDVTDTERKYFLGYIYFIRGYAYYNLLMQYGPVVLLGDNILETNETVEYYARSRALYHESVDSICADFERAAKNLPTPQNVPVSVFGRPSKGAALGLIARLRLQQASHLFNGGEKAKAYYGNWTRKTDGQHYISQNYDEKRWAVAAQAAKRIIDGGAGFNYTLHTVERDSIGTAEWRTRMLPSNVSKEAFPNGAGNIDAFRSYSDMFTGETLSQRNPEFLWARFSSHMRDWISRSFPVYPLAGNNNNCVPQNIIDEFYMEDGCNATVSESSEDYPFSEDKLSGDRYFSGYKLSSGTHGMYVNREMRFYASIGFSNRFWLCNSVSMAEKTNNYREVNISYELDGNGGKANSTANDPDAYAITGYVITKYIHRDDALRGTQAALLSKTFPIIRYAEILLSYAEALNELGEGAEYVLKDNYGNEQVFKRDENEIRKYFNQVRFRAGLPGLTDAEVRDAKKVRELIERERKIEFLHENRRFYDVRRWGKYEETERELMLGMDIGSNGKAYYTKVPLNHQKARTRLPDRKCIFLPIAETEMRKSDLLDQNPGW